MGAVYGTGASGTGSKSTSGYKYDKPVYKGKDYTAEAAAIVDSQIASGKAINKSARTAAIRDYANALASLESARASNSAQLDKYAAVNAAKRAASMASRGMDVGESAATADAATTMLHESKLADILAAYQQGVGQATRDRDQHFDEVRNNDAALDAARAGKVNELSLSLGNQDYQRWLGQAQLNATIEQAQAAYDAQLRAEALAAEDRRVAAQNNAMLRQQTAAKYMAEWSKSGLSLPDIAAKMRSFGFTDAETTAAYGALTANSAAYNRVRQLQGSNGYVNGGTGFAPNQGWIQSYFDRASGKWNPYEGQSLPIGFMRGLFSDIAGANGALFSTYQPRTYGNKGQAYWDGYYNPQN